MFKSRKIFLPTLSFLFVFSLISTQVFGYACPNYEFNTDLQYTATHPDVRAIQEILNADKRTLVSQSGPGSVGHETSYFGKATREALKRFQALFIEYIGIANGKLGPKTRISMNAVCKGPFFTKGTGNVYDVTPKDTIPPVIALAGPYEATIDTPFRTFLGGNEPIQTPPLTSLIVENATVGDLRKISSTTYSFLVTPNLDAQDDITIQVEADKVKDIAGNANEDASNVWTVHLTLASTTATDTATITDLTFPDFNLLTATGTDCSTVASVDINDYTNPCYGKVPMTGQNDQNQQEQQDQQMMQMLSQLLQGLMGALKDAGGGTGGESSCACHEGPTTLFAPVKGIPGASRDARKVKGPKFVGFQGPADPKCGRRKRGGPTDMCKGEPGAMDGDCCGVNFNASYQPYNSTVLIN
jgi:hypothetical protein